MTESASSSPPKDQDIFGNELRLSGKYTTVDRVRSSKDVYICITALIEALYAVQG